MARRKMHDNELDIDASLVRRLLGLQFPNWAHLPLKAVRSSGTHNALYRLGSDMVVRLPRIRWSAEDAEDAEDQEQRWLPKLAPLLPTAIPVPLAQGMPACGYPWRWSICPWLSGENPRLGDLADPHLLARDLAAFVLALHQIDLAGGPPASRGGPLGARDAETRAAIADLEGLIDTAAVTAAWESALATTEWSGSAVWLHADLSPGNVLIVKGRLTAVIDFGMLGMGDPACDLIVAWNLLPADGRATFRTALQVDQATWARGRGWAREEGNASRGRTLSAVSLPAPTGRTEPSEVLRPETSGLAGSSVKGDHSCASWWLRLFVFSLGTLLFRSTTDRAPRIQGAGRDKSGGLRKWQRARKKPSTDGCGYSPASSSGWPPLAASSAGVSG